MCHYPLAECIGFFREGYHIYGHIHNNTNQANEYMKPFDKVGTESYMAPEVYNPKLQYDFCADWWSLGCIIYEMLEGKELFSPRTFSRSVVESEINCRNYDVDLTHLRASEEIKDLIKNLLIVDAKKRLGALGAQSVKSHPYFKDVNWTDVQNLKVSPPDNYEGNSKPAMAGFNNYSGKDKTPIGKGDYYENFSFE